MAETLETHREGGFRDVVGGLAQQRGGAMDAVALKIFHPRNTECLLKQQLET